MNNLVDASFDPFQGIAVPFEYLLLMAVTEEVQFLNSGMRLKEDETQDSIKRADNVLGLFHGQMATPPFHKDGDISVEMLD